METTIKKVPKTKEQWGSFLNHFKQNKWLYILTIPGIIYFAVFRYAPMYGLIIAFKDYVESQIVHGSEHKILWISSIILISFGSCGTR